MPIATIAKSSSADRTAVSVVAGATGLVGGLVVKQLSARDLPVVALTRRAMVNCPALVEPMQVDFEALPVGLTLPPCEHLYICLGTTIKRAGSRAAFRHIDVDYAVALAARAKEAGANKLSLVSSVGADAASSNFYLRTKGDVERALLDMKFASLNIYRPGLLIGEREQRRWLESVGQTIARVIDPLLVGSLSRYRSIAATALATAMVDPVRHRPGTHYWHYADL